MTGDQRPDALPADGADDDLVAPHPFGPASTRDVPAEEPAIAPAAEPEHPPGPEIAVDDGPDGDDVDATAPEAPVSEGGSSGGTASAGAEPAEEPQDAPRAAEPTGEATGEPAGEPPSGAGVSAEPAAVAPRRRRRRDPMAAALIGVLTLLLGFAFAVQVRSVGDDELLAGAREEDLVRILDDVNAREERLREQITDQRSALQQLSSSDSQSATALEEARRRAEAIGILNGTIAARGPGLTMTIRDPEKSVRVADILDAIQELRGAGAETMQIDGVRVGVSTAVTGDPGGLMIDGRPITAPYEFLVIGSPQDMETAMNIPGGVVQRITGRGGSVPIVQSEEVVVDALRPLDTPQYAAPDTDD
jgi:uncharacterized protein YlxW (UPF0749 family)